MDRESIKGALKHQGSFNLLHYETMFKVDIFFAKNRSFDRAQLSPRVLKTLSSESPRQVYVLAAEDNIVAKLEWYRMAGEASERHWRDVLGIMKTKLSAARKQACIMLGEIAKGNDPRTGRRINTLSDITLQEVLQKFLETKPIREATKLNYVSAINCHFQEWLDKPIASITKDMVEQRHCELTVAPDRLGPSGHGRANNALKKLSALINFAADRYGTDDEPLIKSNPVSRISKNRAWHRIHPRQGIIPDHKLKGWYQGVSTLVDFSNFLM